MLAILKPGKLLKWLAIVAGSILVLLMVTLALPIESWRTGRLPEPPLPVLENGPEVELPRRIWIDTDAACGLTRRTDPDDCFALMLMAGLTDVKIAGISTVFGNADLRETDEVTRALADKLERDGRPLPPVLRGAAGPVQTATDARDGLRRALANGPLTILALGPLTNIAAALKNRPDLRNNVARIVAVMGRRPGHIFHPSEGNGAGIFLGHGPVFRDFNFDKDRRAATELLAMDLPVSLIPYDAARTINLTGRDLERLSRAGAVGPWIASAARGWLDFWREEIGHDGFYPFDLAAGGYVDDPSMFDCAFAPAWVSHDKHLSNFWFFDPVALQVGLPEERPAEPAATSQVIYCVSADPGLHNRLMNELLGEAPGTETQNPIGPGQ